MSFVTACFPMCRRLSKSPHSRLSFVSLLVLFRHTLPDQSFSCPFFIVDLLDRRCMNQQLRRSIISLTCRRHNSVEVLYRIQTTIATIDAVDIFTSAVATHSGDDKRFSHIRWHPSIPRTSHIGIRSLGVYVEQMEYCRKSRFVPSWRFSTCNSAISPLQCVTLRPRLFLNDTHIHTDVIPHEPPFRQHIYILLLSINPQYYQASFSSRSFRLLFPLTWLPNHSSGQQVM
ncbi:hypothetical protein P153DRAFT_205782 [Dothidotthia symphoricarpi CBS 119687]|uniref:Uncharacterized protein n=1 Tax=Dothidotthia symphoricarpi CBS 119687 TaxID=1392245 RepID=A0A6A6AFU0_9PLEO|nr:uncharacterized protein P153DRAFT_205782 [Dothidotthia symphoricarpi CBS 119687]KAF2130842.1 hypothetical protein P153DRAFT_205782 [Dothidotthia symphoricarpi CBS 119687]